MQSSSSSVPAVLSRYPAEVQAAYVRFTADGNEADLSLLVRAALREYMPRQVTRAAPELTADQRLIEDLGIDSLAVAEMIFFFEDLFNVSIPSNEILGVKTVGELDNYVKGKLAAPKPTA
jgi:acyl carrier protein